MWIGGAPLYELLLLLLIVVGLTIALRGVGRPSNRVATPGAGNFFFSRQQATSPHAFQACTLITLRFCLSFLFYFCLYLSLLYRY